MNENDADMVDQTKTLREGCRPPGRIRSPRAVQPAGKPSRSKRCQARSTRHRAGQLLDADAGAPSAGASCGGGHAAAEAAAEAERQRQASRR
ncbi:MAG: hypothetical protein ACLT98_10980 [Eggerthellaceae bacterium]